MITIIKLIYISSDIGNLSVWYGKCSPAHDSENRWGVRSAHRKPNPRIGFPMGNQACIVPRLLVMRLTFAKTPSPWIEAAYVYSISLK